LSSIFTAFIKFSYIMSLILALDSSTDACSVALYQEGELNSVFELAAKSHTQRLLPMVDELLKQSGISLKELDAIAFGRGPGSFTGLRICAGIVQGLAFGTQLPVIPVSTLEAQALAYTRANPDNQYPIIAALDARMNEVYWGMFQPHRNSVQAVGNEQVMSPEALVNDPRVQSLDGHFVAIGSGWHYPDMQVSGAKAIVMDTYPHASDIALIAAEHWTQGRAVNVLDAQPVYLRDSVSWQKRQRIRHSD